MASSAVGPRSLGVSDIRLPGAQVLVVDDDEDLCALISAHLTQLGYRPLVCHAASQALDVLHNRDVDVVLSDVRMQGMNGLELCERIKGGYPGVPVVLVTAWASMQAAVDALRAGAFDFLTKPIDMPALAVTIERATRQRAAAQVSRLEQGGRDVAFDEILGTSRSIRQLCEMLQRVAQNDATALITGESGTGKELVARVLHQHSPRAHGRFVAINCAAMPESLLESQLFGHVKGAFTDARTARPGLLVQADEGTLFLDEIGDMPLSLQPKLLRALQERVVRPLGAEIEVPFDTRLVVATNRDLEAEVRRGRFRSDLYYRINVIHIEVPPLRERGTDALLIAERAVHHFAARSGKAVAGITPAAAEKLLAYRWPGNVRELHNCIERAVALTRHREIIVDDLPVHIRHYESWPSASTALGQRRLLSIEEVERRHILEVLRAVDDNKTLAARVLGLDRKTLYRKLRQYQVQTLDSDDLSDGQDP